MNKRLFFLFPNTSRALKLARDFKQHECQLSDLFSCSDPDYKQTITPLYSKVEPWLWDMVFAIFFLELTVLMINAI